MTTDAVSSTDYAPSVGSANANGPIRVAYLFGSGATEGAVRHAGGTISQIMSALATDLMTKMSELIDEEYESDRRLLRLVNELANELDEPVDFEHLITFFQDSPSSTLRDFGGDLKFVFNEVLRNRLDDIDGEIGDKASELFAVLVDMYSVAGIDESLKGFLSLNYDTYLEHAVVERLGRTVDYGFLGPNQNANAVRVLKLHGSFGWTDEWPPTLAIDRAGGLWIPPGIRKAKDRYPFNSLWGAAMDLLDCEIVRIVGCNLSSNDWDLVSLLFSTKYAHATADPFEIEIIGSPSTARRIQERFPYLLVRSIFEATHVGPSIIVETIGTMATYSDLTPDERKRAMDDFAKDNVFEYWLVQMAEYLSRTIEEHVTPTQTFARFVEAYVGR